MAVTIPFDMSFTAPYRERQQVMPGLARVLAENPGPFTFKGSSAYFVGEDDVALIDPGPDTPDHVEALKRALGGRRLTHIFVTHTHIDHSPAAAPLKAWSGATTYGFGPHGSGRLLEGPEAEAGGDRDFIPDVALKDGEIVRANGFTIEAVYTPGHCSNHMCYGWREQKALFTGDHIMGWATTVVGGPDGDMGEYIDSLKKVIARKDALLIPTHGGPIRDPQPYLQAYLDHRMEREAEIVACIRDGLVTIPDMVARIYAKYDKALHAAAGRSVHSHLKRMAREGLVAEDNGRWRVAA